MHRPGVSATKLLTKSGHLRLRAGEFVATNTVRTGAILAIQSGITAAPSRPYVGLRAMAGALTGGWRRDGFYYYEGASSPGLNDRFVSAASQDKPIHLFEQSGDVVRYVDEFVLNDVLPNVPGRQTVFAARPGPLFQLAPVTTVAHVPGQLSALCDESEVCFRRVERAELIEGTSLPAEDLRPENELVIRFCRYLLARGHKTHRLQIRHTVDHRPLFTDVWVDDAFLLIEAKAAVERDAIRDAIGQLADYTRFLPNPQRAVLLPHQPERDLVELAHSERAAVIWPQSAGRWVASVGWFHGIGIDRCC